MSNYDIISPYGTTRRLLPSRTVEGQNGPLRQTPYGDVYTQPLALTRHAYANAGCYFIAHNATNDAATTLAGHAAPVLVDADATMTKPFIHLMMGGTVGSAANGAGVKAELDYIQIEVITAGANGTADSWAAQLDTGATRVSSGGTALTRLNPNMQSSTEPLLACLGGAVVTGAESANVRHLAHGQFRPSIQIAGDKYTFLFGGDPAAAGTSSIATIAHHTIVMPPVCLGPTDQFLLALYSPSQSAAGVYKVRMGWVEQ
jgi:hypothetical protein